MQNQELQALIEKLSEDLGLDLQSTTERLEDTLHLERDALLQFTHGDDWTFIIKTHAFLEAAMTHFLTEYFHEEKLQDIFAYLELGHTKTGKMEFLKALGLLESDEEHLLRQFSKLRNVLVHDISNIYFDLNTYVAQLNKQQRRNFIRAFTYWKLSDTPEFEELNIILTEIADKIAIYRPKMAIFMSISSFIERIFARPEQRRREEEVRQQYNALKEDLRQGIELLKRKSLEEPEE